MTDTDDLRFDRVDPTRGKARLLAVADRDRPLYKATLGDAHAFIIPRDGRLRIPYVEAEGDVRMSDLLDAVVESVGSESVTTRRIRFVCIPTDDEDEVTHALRELAGIGDRLLEDILVGAERVDEEWHPDTHDCERAQTVPCLDVEWNPDL